MELEELLERLERKNLAFAELFGKLYAEGNFEYFKESLRLIEDEEWRNTYLTSLALTNLFHKNKTPYILVGGTAVFARIFNYIGTNALKEWRGSFDIDLAVYSSIEKELKSAFAQVQKMDEFLGGIKRYCINGDVLSSFDDIDYQPVNFSVMCDIWDMFNADKHLKEAEITALHTAPELNPIGSIFKVYTLPLKEQIVLKLSIEQPREKDIQDVFNLLGISERLGLTLNFPKEKIKSYLQEFSRVKDILIVQPSLNHLKSIQA